MARPIVYVDTSKVREGKLEELEPAMADLATFVKENVPPIQSYAFYLDEDRSRMTVVAVHPDSASLAYHMDVGRKEFGKFADLIELERIAVYGEVDQGVRERLDQKVQMLGGTVSVHRFQVGFTR